MIKYRTRWHGCSMACIEALDVVRESEKQVVLPSGSREAKRSDFNNWFDTWDEAHAFLMKHAQRTVDNLRLNLESANGALGRIKGMKPPSAVGPTEPPRPPNHNPVA